MTDTQISNTATQIGQAVAMKKYNEVPIDVLPDDSFARLYKPGSRTLAAKNADEDTRQYDLSLQENKRASQVQEVLDRAKLDETIRSNKADESYKSQLLNLKANSGDSGSVDNKTGNPFGGNTQQANNSGTSSNRAYSTQDLDNYIFGLKESLQTPEAVIAYLQSQAAINPIKYLQGSENLENFFQDALIRLQDLVSD